MALENMPYKFEVQGIKFDVVFRSISIPLEYNCDRLYDVTLVSARKSGTTETLAAKAIHNRQDNYDYMLGQRVAFKRLLKNIFYAWKLGVVLPCMVIDKRHKSFVSEGRKLAYLAGMWDGNEDE
jgi:hypothetical protein